MEIAAALGEKVATPAVDGIWRQIRYVLDYNDNITNLREKLRDLEDAKSKVGRQVEEATRGLEQIHDHVRTWILRAEAAVVEAENILAVADASGKTCCNIKNRYKPSKRAKLQAPVIANLAEKGISFIQVGYGEPLHPQAPPNDDYEAFESRQTTLNSIMDALRIRDAGLIGVWGLGGVGKTTLAKEVGKRMKDEGIFQRVVMVEVHPKAEIKTIQERVADWVVEIKKKVVSRDSVELRAQVLRQRLMQEKSVLVILDDVWDPIDLFKVGIPIGGDVNRCCTVLVTTRHGTVVSTMADMANKDQILFPLNVLNDDEAWKLFQKMVGAIPKEDVATEIVQRCGGLPVLILPVAAVLKNKALYEWKDALLRLQTGLQKSGDKMQADAYSALELSCSYLGAEHKSLFLLCGLLVPHDIGIEDLVRYTVGLSLFGYCSTVEATRSRVLTLVGDLESSCLLQKGEKHECFTMHDVVHRFARGYQDDVYSPWTNSVIEDWPKMHRLLTQISLPCSKLPYLPTRLECPELKVFILYSDKPDQPQSTWDHDRFFEAVEALQVLDLSRMRLQPLPSSLQCLLNLETLCLHECIVDDVAAIGNLVHLKILSLSGTNIVHFPKELGKLVCLQYLALNECRELKQILPGILSCLTHLQELYMRDSFTQWGLRDKTNGQQINADLAELKKLKNLLTLEIGVADVTSFSDDHFCDNLERFFIVVGDCWDWSRNEHVSRTLKLKLDASIKLLKKMSVLLNKADDVHIDNSAGVKAVYLPELNKEGFGHHLKNLQLQNFHEVKYLVNGKKGCYFAFPKLEELVIVNAQHLENICNGSLADKSFSNLKHLKVSGCETLSNIFPLSVARCLSELKIIEVTNCEKMEGVFLIDLPAQHLEKICNGSEFLNNLEQIKISDCDAMGNVFPLSMARCLSKLEDIEVTNCAKMEGIFLIDESSHTDERIYLTHLRNLTLQHLPRLDNIFTQKWHGISMMKETSTHALASDAPVFNGSSLSVAFFNEKVIFLNIKKMSVSSLNLCKIWDDRFPNTYSCIKTLEIIDCKNIIVIFTISMVNSLSHLKTLIIRKCGLLQEIITSDEHGEENKICLPKLEILALEELHSLLRVCTGSLIECQNLHGILIEDCPKLETFIASSSSGHQPRISLFDNKVLFPKLELVHISKMHDLIAIWHEEVLEESFTNLKLLCVEKVRSLSELFSSVMLRKVHTLEKLWLEECNSLEKIFDLQYLMSERGKHPQRISMLTEIKVMNLPQLKHVWHGDPYGILSFQNLHKVQFHQCSSLDSIMPDSVAQELPRLEDIELVICPQLEQIVSKGEIYEEQDVETTFEFPNLKRIQIWGLDILKRFYPGKHTIDWPALQEVEIMGCPQLEVFKPEYDKEPQVSKEPELDHQSSFDQPLFSFGQLVSLETVSLNSQQIHKILEQELPDVLSSTLKSVHLQHFNGESENLPINFLQRFPNLEELQVGVSDFVELFEEEGTSALSCIRILRLVALSALKHIWNPQSNLDLIQKNLRSLEVWMCDSLIHLAPPSSSFCNLTTLDVRRCNSLVSLFTFSTITSLEHLKKMIVAECNKLTEIASLSDEEIVGETQICLSKLETIGFSNLGRITSFCSQTNATFKFPMLVLVVVEECPKMEFFSPGYLSSPKLKKVWLTENQDYSCWKGDLNTTIRQLYTERRLIAEEAVEEEDPADLFEYLLKHHARKLGLEETDTTGEERDVEDLSRYLEKYHPQPQVSEEPQLDHPSSSSLPLFSLGQGLAAKETNTTSEEEDEEDLFQHLIKHKDEYGSNF